MPDRRSVKWGDMTSGTPHMPEKWEHMEAGDTSFSDKWHELEHTPAHMSEKWDIFTDNSTEFSDRWHEMKQEKRIDPYAMHSSDGNRAQPTKSTPKESISNKVGRATQHTEFGSTREI